MIYALHRHDGDCGSIFSRSERENLSIDRTSISNSYGGSSSGSLVQRFGCDASLHMFTVTMICLARLALPTSGLASTSS